MSHGTLPRWFVILVSMVLLFQSCKHEPLVAPEDPLVNNGGGGGQEPDPADTCDTNIVWFEQEVMSIFITHCAMVGCHNIPTNANHHIMLTSYDGIMGGEAGGPDNDQLQDIWEAINRDPDHDDHMPPLEDDDGDPLDQLTSEEIALIGAWIDQGANNNSCEGGCQLTNVGYASTILPIVQDRCQGSCHAGTNPEGGLDFSTWEDLNAVAGDGRLELAIQHLEGAQAMPPSGPMLSQCRIDQILAWVQDGAPNN